MAGGQPLPWESQSGTFTCLGGFNFAVPRGRGCLQGIEKFARDCGDPINRCQKCRFVGFGWLVEATHLAYKLQRSRSNFVLCYGRNEIEERFDVATHFHYPEI